MNFILTRASISLLFISLQINEQLRVLECATDFVRVLRKKKKTFIEKFLTVILLTEIVGNL